MSPRLIAPLSLAAAALAVLVMAMWGMKALTAPFGTSDSSSTSAVCGPASHRTVKRADGKLQLTIGGWPVYRYSGDKAAGDTTGQGVGKVWFAVTPAGKKAVATG